MKKWMSIVTSIVLMISLLSGCGGGSQTADQNAAQKTETEVKSGTEIKTELTFWVLSTDTEGVLNEYDRLVNDFSAKNPNITIRKELVPSDKINEKISIAVNTNAMPDLQNGSAQWVLSYAQRNKLVPLDDLIEKTDYDEALLNSLSVSGKLYVIPHTNNAIGLAVNRTAFKEANANDLLPKDSTETWSFDDFKKAAKAVTDPAKNRYGFGLYCGDTGGDQMFHAMLWGFGAKSYSDDNMQSVLNSPEAAEGLKFLISLQDEGLVPPGAVALKGNDVISKMFPAGQVCMVMANSGHMGQFRQTFKDGTNKEFELDLVAFPTKDGKSSNSVSFTSGYFIWNTENQDKINASEEFIKFATDKENMTKMAEQTGVISPLKSLADKYKPDTDDGKVIPLFKYAGNVGIGVPGYSEIRPVLIQELQAAFTKAKTPEKVLEDFQNKANDIIKQQSAK